MELIKKILKSKAIALGVVAFVYLTALCAAYLVYSSSSNKLSGLFKGFIIFVLIVFLFVMLFDAIYERVKR